MTAGLEVRNDYGTFLITDRDPSLALRYKRTISTDGTGYATTTFSGVEIPIVAIRSSATVYAVTQHRSASSVTVTLWSQPANSSVELFVFDRPIETPGNFGLQVFDADGKCTFDSSRQYGRVVASNPPVGDWIGVSGRTYAAAILSQRWLHEFENTNQPGVFDHYYYSSAVRSIPNGMWTSPRYVYQVVPESHPARPDNYFRGNSQPLIVVLDVTGY